jgi:hypothetical protein
LGFDFLTLLGIVERASKGDYYLLPAAVKKDLADEIGHRLENVRPIDRRAVDFALGCAVGGFVLDHCPDGTRLPTALLLACCEALYVAFDLDEYVREAGTRISNESTR